LKPYFGLRSYTDAGQHYGGQIGSEATPGEWVAALVECTREWVRVLKPSGSIFVNLGDKYSTGNSGQLNTDFNERWGNSPGARAHGFDRRAGTHVLNHNTITGYACACGEAPGDWQQRQAVTPAHTSRPAAQPWGDHPNQPPGLASLPPTRPAVVLDPFGGTGTTALVATVHGRHGITIDLSADYCRLAQWRINDPAERARALRVPKPPPIPDGMETLF
jgi:hypothetical protein